MVHFRPKGIRRWSTDNMSTRIAAVAVAVVVVVVVVVVADDADVVDALV